jgi:hypothetical protein
MDTIINPAEFGVDQLIGAGCDVMKSDLSP